MSGLLNAYLRDREELGETFQERMRHLANGFESMELLVRATPRDLLSLGVNLASVYKEIERMADAFKAEGFEVRRFPGFRFLDVPKDHWADQAVHSLRNAGILVGYPNGRFDGK